MIQPSAFLRLVEWIDRREALRLRTAKGSHQMDAWRWCNVNRCEDRETRWIFRNIIEANDGSPVLWFNLVIARFLNWSPTLEAVGYFEEWDEERFCRTIRARMLSGEKVYTGAYMIRAGTGEDAKLTKERYLCKRVFSPLWERRTRAPGRAQCADWDAFFAATFGMGDFMRNQVITDMKYSHHLPASTTLDWSIFCLAGPGTSRGLCRLHGEEPRTTWKTAHRDLLELRAKLVAFYGDRGNNYLIAAFRDLNNVSNSMCEFDKYCRLLNGEGTPRSRYAASPSPLP